MQRVMQQLMAESDQTLVVVLQGMGGQGISLCTKLASVLAHFLEKSLLLPLNRDIALYQH